MLLFTLSDLPSKSSPVDAWLGDESSPRRPAGAERRQTTTGVRTTDARGVAREKSGRREDVTEKDLQEETAGRLPADLRKRYLLEDDGKYDIVPEIYNGKNVADFIDPEIEAIFAELEREEDELEARAERADRESRGAARRRRARCSAARTRRNQLVAEHRRKSGRQQQFSHSPQGGRRAQTQHDEHEDEFPSMGLTPAAAGAAWAALRLRRSSAVDPWLETTTCAAPTIPTIRRRCACSITLKSVMRRVKQTTAAGEADAKLPRQARRRRTQDEQDGQSRRGRSKQADQDAQTLVQRQERQRQDG